MTQPAYQAIKDISLADLKDTLKFYKDTVDKTVKISKYKSKIDIYNFLKSENYDMSTIETKKKAPPKVRKAKVPKVPPKAKSITPSKSSKSSDIKSITPSKSLKTQSKERSSSIDPLQSKMDMINMKIKKINEGKDSYNELIKFNQKFDDWGVVNSYLKKKEPEYANLQRQYMEADIQPEYMEYKYQILKNADKSKKDLLEIKSIQWFNKYTDDIKKKMINIIDKYTNQGLTLYQTFDDNNLIKGAYKDYDSQEILNNYMMKREKENKPKKKK